MGCGASANAGQLRAARQQVDDLQRKLAESTAAQGALQKQLDACREEVCRATAAASAAPAAPQSASAPIVEAAAGAEAPGQVGARDDKAEDQQGAAAVTSSTAKATVAKERQQQQQEAPVASTGDAFIPSLGAQDQAEVELGPASGAAEPPSMQLPGVVICEEDTLPLTQNTEGTLSKCSKQDGSQRRAELESNTLNSLSEASVMEVKDDRHMVRLETDPSDEVADLVLKKPPSDLKPQTEGADGKLSGSMASTAATASTCTPSANANAVQLNSCHQCGVEEKDLYLDTSDMNRYCDDCWVDFYGSAPRPEVLPLVNVEVAEIWPEERLSRLWAEHILPGWPPPVVGATPAPASARAGQEWTTVRVRVHRQVVGGHAREQNNIDPIPGEMLAERYRVRHVVGEGHFTKAYLADDLQLGAAVCLKRHRNLSVEALADLLVLSRRMSDKDEGGKLFPLMLDAFYDVVGFTVETLIEGRNCLTIAQSDPTFFKCMRNLRHVAMGALQGLVVLEQAGAVHNDVKPDNLIWTEVPSPDGSGALVPFVKVVDFGCARLDSRIEPLGRNWSLAEGGAGHLGKWSPEMALRLPITHASDVWGTAISLCELHCGRFVWRNEADTAEVVLAQALGLCGLTSGLPSSLLRRSPLDVRQLYTPAPCHFPVRQSALGRLEALRPSKWGLEQVLGEKWREREEAELGRLVEFMLVVDPHLRPSAARVLECCAFVTEQKAAAADGGQDSAEDPKDEEGQQEQEAEVEEAAERQEQDEELEDAAKPSPNLA